MKQLTTRWGRAIDPANVKPEYPRPGLVRDSYVNLNGTWSLGIDRSETCEGYDREILVPFAPEAPLSGVGVIIQPEDRLHYRRTFALPEGFNRGRVLLHFGAVDQECAVRVNGQPVGSHRGGYNPFCFDITGALIEGENALEVDVRDMTEHAPYARGKQKLVRKGDYASIFYTPSSGIWKTVWLESVPEDHVTGLWLTPRFDEAQISLTVNATTPGPAQVRVSFRGETAWQGAVQAGVEALIDLPGFHPWTPETPALYDVEVAFGADAVRSYFGMRKFSMAPDGRGILRFWLNNEPFFFNGLLDQGYWPDGLLTAPSEAALEYDITTLKAMGYNTLRKHVKVEEERFYYLCDQLGMVVWQDMPNFGGE